MKAMTTEHLAGWYFRLNGFFTITNFVLHPSRRGAQRTDADIVGVRFPYRSEFPDAPGGDEPEFTHLTNRPYFVIAEVKRSLCLLNGPWTDETKQNIHAVLCDLGPFPQERVREVAQSLYQRGVYDCSQFYCSLFCVGNEKNPDVTSRYPHVPQRTWEQILRFLFERFQTYSHRKADHDSWDEVGKELWNASRGTTKEKFVKEVKTQMGFTTL